MTGSISRSAWERLNAYLDGELSAAEIADVERELERDDALRAALEKMRRVSKGMSVEDVDVRAAHGIRSAVRERLRRPSVRAGRSAMRWWWLPAAAALAAVALVALYTAGPLAPTQPRVHVQAVAEQYALALDELGGGQP
jgi:anti-sigma factor RsiW